MNRELLSKAFGDIDESFILEAYRPVLEDALSSSERIVCMKKKRIITFALAAALMLTLGGTAYAVWNIHAARQQELKADLNIAQNNVSSYVEYELPNEPVGDLVLLSTLSDGLQQRVYVNISPVSEEEATAYSEAAPFPVYTLEIEGTGIGGSAYPLLSAGRSVSSSEQMSAAVLEEAYDKESQTLTLEGFLDVSSVKRAMTELGTDIVSLSVQMFTGVDASRTFGPIPFALTGEQRRGFDFGHALYHDADLDKDIEIVGLELTPFSAVWKVHYEGDAAVHAPETAWEVYEPWCNLEDKVCQEAKIVFSDGSEFSTGGALNSHYENGTVNLWCSWKRTINMDDIQRIVLGDVILWEAK